MNHVDQSHGSKCVTHTHRQSRCKNSPSLTGDLKIIYIWIQLHNFCICKYVMYILSTLDLNIKHILHESAYNVKARHERFTSSE